MIYFTLWNEEFGIQLNNEETESLRTAADFWNLIKAKLAQC